VKYQNTELDRIYVLYKQNSLLEAKSRCEKFILKHKKNVRATQLLAQIEYSSGNSLKAIYLLKKEVESNPGNPGNAGVLIDLGNFYKDQNSYLESLECYVGASKIDPLNLIAYHNCANLMFKMNNYQQAIDLYSKAYHIDNSHVSSLIGIANTYDAMGNYLQAINVFENVLEKFKNNQAGLIGLGNLYRKIGQYEKSLEMAEEAVRHYPHVDNSYYLRGVVRKELGFLNEALDDFTKIIEISPRSALAKNNKAMTHLMMGDYIRGWPLYEARWELEAGQKKIYPSNKPTWNGRLGGSLLIWPEQGVGDQVMYSAILPDVAARVDHLFVLVDPRLRDLFQRSFDDKITFITTREEAEMTGYEAQLPMASLARYFRNSETDFKSAASPFLKPNLQRVESMQRQLEKKENETLVGVSWKSVNPKNGSKRGVELHEFLEKIHVPGVRYVNLQYGDVTEDLLSLKEKSNLTMTTLHDLDNFQDIDGLAALIMACDEVVSIDNSTVHLSGALGQTTTILLQKSPDWRWQLNRSDSPWYHSVKLIRDAIC
jgi:tetratricopeptide (TPR) repeat protein